MRYLMGESLMGRSLDEPFSLYGLLAETIETGPEREWVEFTLRPEARFSDGTPVTVDDVIWSFETLGTVGHPRYHGFYGKIASIEETAARTVRFTFNTPDRELALLAGLRPILPKAQWEGDFPAVQSGDIVKAVLPHERPSGMTGFVMNTRKDVFSDWRVRDAMMHAFNFEFINEAMTGSAQPRISSYWSNSPLGMAQGAAEGRVAEFLAPFADDLTPGTIEGYALPVSDGSERNRANIAAALGQMEAAGWTVQDGVMKNAAGEPFTFEILLQVGATEPQAIIDMYVESLARLGITPTVQTADSAQFKEATDAYDFDMTYYRRGVSLSPGNEQYSYYGTEFADTPGGRNLMGVWRLARLATRCLVV